MVQCALGRVEPALDGLRCSLQSTSSKVLFLPLGKSHFKTGGRGKPRLSQGEVFHWKTTEGAPPPPCLYVHKHLKQSFRTKGILFSTWRDRQFRWLGFPGLWNSEPPSNSEANKQGVASGQQGTCWRLKKVQNATRELFIV